MLKDLIVFQKAYGLLKRLHQLTARTRNAALGRPAFAATLRGMV